MSSPSCARCSYTLLCVIPCVAQDTLNASLERIKQVNDPDSAAKLIADAWGSFAAVPVGTWRTETRTHTHTCMPRARTHIHSMVVYLVRNSDTMAV